MEGDIAIRSAKQMLGLAFLLYGSCSLLALFYIIVDSSGPRIPTRLEYIPPQVSATGIPMVHLLEDVIEEGSEHWRNSLVGYFIEIIYNFLWRNPLQRSFGKDKVS